MIEAFGPNDAAPASPACADCGAEAPGRFCPVCGQKALLDRTLGSMVTNLVHDLLHVDGKLLRTLPLLAFRPGVLTRRYIHGCRTRYVGPNVIFLSTAFLMFLSFNLLPGPQVTAECDPAARSAVQRTGATVRANLEQLGPGVELLLPPASADGTTPAVQWLERHAPAAVMIRLETVLRHPEKALARVKKAAYKLGFLLVPLSMPALWFLVGRRPGVQPYDLAVFSLYSIGFMSFLLTAIILLGGVGLFAWPLYLSLLLTVPPVHFFVQLRDSFGLTTGQAFWRAAILCVVAVASLTLFLALVLAWELFA